MHIAAFHLVDMHKHVFIISHCLNTCNHVYDIQQTFVVKNVPSIIILIFVLNVMLGDNLRLDNSS